MEKNVKALLAKIFGIVSLVLGICGGSGLPFGVAALILSSLAKKTDPDNKDANDTVYSAWQRCRALFFWNL